MSEVQKTPITQVGNLTYIQPKVPSRHAERKPLVDNSTEIGGPMVLGPGKYMRHTPSGRVYPFEANGAKREDVEIFVHKADGSNQRVNKPPKPVKKGPFAHREEGVGSFDRPGDAITITN